MVARKELLWCHGWLTNSESPFKMKTLSFRISKNDLTSVLFCGKTSVLILVVSHESERTQRLKSNRLRVTRNSEIQQ